MSELGLAGYLFRSACSRLIHMRSQRTVAMLIGLALVVAACGGGATDAASPAETSPPEAAGQTTAVPEAEPGTTPATEPGAEPSTTSAERPAPDPNREIAPDFNLLLADGSTFVLSEETRPVFMVFWAEW